MQALVIGFIFIVETREMWSWLVGKNGNITSKIRRLRLIGRPLQYSEPRAGLLN
jgi:hypothetical protein